MGGQHAGDRPGMRPGQLAMVAGERLVGAQYRNDRLLWPSVAVSPDLPGVPHLRNVQPGSVCLPSALIRRNLPPCPETTSNPGAQPS